MQFNLSNKRLLILGGYPLMMHAVEKAHEYGIHVIVTDWNNSAPAKQIADESYDVSTTNVEELELLARAAKVDGVLLGAVDVNLIPGARLCERLNLPCYATEEQFRKTLDKGLFKELCAKYGIPAVETVLVGDASTHPEYVFPVIVKPVDSYSSKGISVCHNQTELDAAVVKALNVSQANRYIVEPFIQGNDVYLYFTVQDGTVSLSAMADRFVNNSDGEGNLAPQPQLYLLPSRYIDLYYSQAHGSVQDMVSGENIENGSFMMQGFVCGDQIRFFEMGFRITGGAGFIHIRNQNEIDQLAMHIRYALGAGFGPWKLAEYDNPRFSKPACVIVPLLADGTIGKIYGLDAIRKHPAFVDVVQLCSIGDKVAAQGTLNQAFARIFLAANSERELVNAILFAKGELNIIDTDGHSMLLPWFEDSELECYFGACS